MKIVIVEDEIRIREGIRNLLRKMFSKHEVVGEAENGEEGLEMVMKLRPDLIITDIKMPVMDGLDMLTVLHESDCRAKAIVLSAYSEFAYAQKAIKLNVSEYLLKPIVVGDFAQSIRNIELQYEQEQKESPDSLGSLEHIMFNIIFGAGAIEEDIMEYMGSRYGIYQDTDFCELLVYMGSAFADGIDRLKREMTYVLSENKEIQYCMIDVPMKKSLLILLYGYSDAKAAERWFQNVVLMQKRGNEQKRNSYGWVNAQGIHQLRESYQLLAGHMDWNIVFGDTIMISYPKITQVQTVACTYPVELENRAKVALCAFDFDKVLQCIRQFNEFFRDGKIYLPKEIKESYVRFIWAVINVAKEIGAIDYQRLEQQQILQTIMEAHNDAELREISEFLYRLLVQRGVESGNTDSLLVKRAQSMIHEFYDTGITLEEIAQKLNVTPEYLGTLFHKETGTHFSTYIREHRITKAKELLIGTQMKIYEIADQVGYADAKYFSRVFKESTGQLPADYRRTNK